MSTIQTTACAIVVDLHAKACGELFEAYGLTRHIHRGDGDTREANRAAYVSVVGATGDAIRLSSTVSMDARLLARTHPSGGADVPEREVQDWCREINNQLMGRLKNKLLRLGCEVATGLPVLISGTDVAAVAMPDIDHRQYFFSSKFGAMTFTLEMLFGPGFGLDTTQAPDAHEIRAEGAMALF
jgi:CheY-specific phosphatase CheX